ncbi:kelch-like protein 9 [Mytilus californianus]|uniref:kelch-like protein 9 n=1 Tax=Mytilus californianus TaxID=6549 RepID=UPI002245D111|nr:kelch-like protein 9 [Mytilus californianus]
MCDRPASSSKSLNTKNDIMTNNQRSKSKTYGDTVIQQFRSLRDKDELCDFQVSADGRIFKVHKAMLAATSDYFRVMFSGTMAESKQDMIDLKGVSAEGLFHIIEFIYSGEIALTLLNLQEVVHTASHLQVMSALDLCSSYIKSLLTFENAKDFLSIANTYSLYEVLKHWHNLILSNFYDFAKTKLFVELDSSDLIDYISDDKLRTSSESKLFKILDIWFRSNPSSIASGVALRVLNHIRFGLMTELELSTVQESEVIKRCVGSIQNVLKGFKFHTDCRKGHPVIDESCIIRHSRPALILVHYGSSHQPFQITSYDPRTEQFYSLFSDLNGSRDCRINVIDNFTYICSIVDFGGGTLMSSTFRFDPRHLVGQDLPPMRKLRLDFALVADKECLYVFGGSNEQYAILDSVECFNVKTNTWSDLPPLPSAVHSLAAEVYGDKIYLSGGVSSHDRQATNTFISYSPGSRKYDSMRGMFYARRVHEMVAFKGKMYVFGGIPRRGVPLHGQIPIEYYDFETNQWNMLSSTLSGRSIGHYIVFENEILSLGHEHQNAKENEIWVYNPDCDSWKNYAKAPQRANLTSAICCQMQVNFDDEKVVKKVF